MIGECAVHLDRHLDSGSRVGILATTGTLASGLFQSALGAHGLQAVTLSETPGGSERQRRVMEAIYGRPTEGEADAVYGLKTHGYSETARNVLLHAARILIHESGCQALVAGCTEIPLALPEPRVDGVPLVDRWRSSPA